LADLGLDEQVCDFIDATATDKIQASRTAHRRSTCRLRPPLSTASRNTTTATMCTNAASDINNALHECPAGDAAPTVVLEYSAYMN